MKPYNYKDQGFGITVVGQFSSEGTPLSGAIVFQVTPRVGVTLKVNNFGWGIFEDLPDLAPALASLTRGALGTGDTAIVTQADIIGLLEENGVGKWINPIAPKPEGY